MQNVLGCLGPRELAFLKAIEEAGGRLSSKDASANTMERKHRVVVVAKLKQLGLVAERINVRDARTKLYFLLHPLQSVVMASGVPVAAGAT